MVNQENSGDLTEAECIDWALNTDRCGVYGTIDSAGIRPHI